jgi:hypothetical protein
MSQNQYGKKSQKKVGNELFENIELFKYLGTTLTNQNYIHEKILS